MSRSRPLLLFLALLLLPPFATAWAQTRPATTPSPPPAAAITPDQARAALDTLNDPRKRAAFAATLDALLKAAPPPPAAAATEKPASPAAGEATPAEPAATDPAKPAEGIALRLAPNSLGAQILLTASAFMNAAGRDAREAFETVQSLPLLWGWIVVMATNPVGQRLLLDTGWRVLVTLTLAAGVTFALRVLLRRPLARVRTLGAHDPPLRPGQEDEAQARAEHGETEGPGRRWRSRGFWARIRLGLARLALEMVPVLGVLATGHLVAGSTLGGNEVSQLVILAAIGAVAACRTLLALATWLFAPEPPGLRLLPLAPENGAFLRLWSKRLILIGIPGYAVGEVGLLLGLSEPAHATLQKTVALALILVLGYLAIHRRHTVRAWLSAPAGANRPLSRARNGLARTWHWAAVVFLASIWLNWALRAPDAIARGLWYFVMIGLILLAATVARVAVLGLIGLVHRPADGEPAHAVRVRMGAYRPVLEWLARWAVNLVALLAILQLLGLGLLAFLLTSEVGRRIASGVATLSVTIGAAFLLWEVANIAIQRHLETLKREAQAARSARLRTLLPLLRTALSVTIVVVAGLMVLSEIGVNIAPLLAGAGIVGVAIGFGSQTLVRDVITGVFLLLENTMQVGDVVRVGDQSGTVESLSVRTIRLRTEDASVVVIPFSAVTTVVNMTRDFSRAVIAVNVGGGEDVDRVVEALKGIVSEMRAEAAWSAVILDDLEVWGLDRFTDSGPLVKGRVMCTPFGRWPVGREINRRLKLRFENLDIELSTPSMRLVTETPAPPRAEGRPSGGGGMRMGGGRRTGNMPATPPAYLAVGPRDRMSPGHRPAPAPLVRNERAVPDRSARGGAVASGRERGLGCDRIRVDAPDAENGGKGALSDGMVLPFITVSLKGTGLPKGFTK